MCGIAGVYHFRASDQVPERRQTLREMLDAMRHRGPDQLSDQVENGLAMGMVRLSIIDLTSGNQPIFAENGRYSIVFNGEIYNYKELRRELEAEGRHFSTASDTEVILQGYLARGESFLSALEGMFAFAIYDKVEREIFLARDRFGEKPLYYSLDDNQFVFSSELRSFQLVSGGRSSEIDPQAYWDFLTYRYVPGESSILRGVRKLPPAHTLRVSARGVFSKRYWRLPQGETKRSKVDPSVEFARLFSQAVSRRLVADVPVGIVLSGGLDSCAVLAEASRSRKLNAYHVRFTEDGAADESEYARQMALHCGCPFFLAEMSPHQFLDRLDHFSSILDAPIGDLASIPFKTVCDLAASDLKVALSGEGADEVLAGYGLNGVARRLGILKQIQSVPMLPGLLGRLLPGVMKDSRRSRQLRSLATAYRTWPKANRYHITFQADQAMKQGLADRPLLLDDSARFLDAHYESVKGAEPLNQILYVIAQDWLTENVLMKSDNVSMSASLEVRCPFLDRDLVEFLFRLDGRDKVGYFRGHWESKVLLRRAVSDRVPAALLSRKKMGFPVPAYRLASPLYKEYLRAALSGPNVFYTNFFSRKKVLGLMDDVLANQSGQENPRTHFLWSLATFEKWSSSRLAQPSQGTIGA